MNLKEYLTSCILEEKETVEHLLYIDNSIGCTTLTYEDLLETIRKIEPTLINEYSKFIAITDGYFERVFKILISISSLDTIYIDRTFVALNKYLVSRVNYFYNEEIIKLDITKDYFKYKDSKDKIIISGFDTFIEDMSDYFKDNQIIIV